MCILSARCGASIQAQTPRHYSSQSIERQAQAVQTEDSNQHAQPFSVVFQQRTQRGNVASTMAEDGSRRRHTASLARVPATFLERPAFAALLARVRRAGAPSHFRRSALYFSKRGNDRRGKIPPHSNCPHIVILFRRPYQGARHRGAWYLGVCYDHDRDGAGRCALGDRASRFVGDGQLRQLAATDPPHDPDKTASIDATRMARRLGRAGHPLRSLRQPHLHCSRRRLAWAIGRGAHSLASHRLGAIILPLIHPDSSRCAGRAQEWLGFIAGGEFST